MPFCTADASLLYSPQRACLHLLPTHPGREDESEEDDSIVAHSEEEEEAAETGSGSSEEEEGMLSDEYESADTSESEDDYSVPAVAQPRRTGRMRRPSSVASQLAGVLADEAGEDGGSSSSGGKEEGQQQQQQQAQRGAPEPAGPDEEGQAGGAAPAAARQGKGGKAAPAGSGSAQRRGLFMVVEEDTTSASTAIHLPRLKPVQPPKPGRAAAAAEDEEEEEEDGGASLKLKAGGQQQGAGEEAGEEEEVACDVCGDSEAVDGNVILLCEGKGCRWGRWGCSGWQAASRYAGTACGLHNAPRVHIYRFSCRQLPPPCLPCAAAPPSPLPHPAFNTRCSVAVHQQCYGVHKVPAGKWLCEACKAKLKQGAANCCVCPVVGGALKKVGWAFQGEEPGWIFYWPACWLLSGRSNAYTLGQRATTRLLTLIL